MAIINIDNLYICLYNVSKGGEDMNEIRMNIYSDLILLDIKEAKVTNCNELGLEEEEYKILINKNEKLGYLKFGNITDLGSRYLRSKYIKFV